MKSSFRLQRRICVLVFLLLPIFCLSNTIFKLNHYTDPSFFELAIPSEDIKISNIQSRQLKGPIFHSLTQIDGMSEFHQFLVANDRFVTISDAQGYWTFFLEDQFSNELTISFPFHFLASVQVKNVKKTLLPNQQLVLETITSSNDIPTLLTYTVKNPNGEEIWKYVIDHEINPSSTQTFFLKPQQTLLEGTYQVNLQYFSDNILYTSTDLFEYETQKEVAFSFSPSLILIITLIICAFILGIFLWVIKQR